MKFVALCLTIAIGLLVSPALAPAAPSGQSAFQQAADRRQWVLQSYMKMETIKAGMTRADLLKVFEPEGGESTREEASFDYPECDYFHVQVRFEPVGLAQKHGLGNSNDKITSISEPYIGLAIKD